MLDQDTVDRFTAELRQLCTILEPFARLIKCLESSHSTPADVYLFRLAIISRLHELFKKDSTINGAELPNPVMEDITSILNGEYQEMFQSQSGPVYLAAFFLDVGFRNSDVFLAYSTNAGRTRAASTDLSCDSDLRRSLPAYTQAGGYLFKLLGQLYNRDPNSTPFSHYSSWSDVQAAFHRQLLSFAGGLSPFDQRHSSTQSPREYWENLLSLPSLDLLAVVELLLASIVANSMAEERTMSTITKLNSPDRSCQKVPTLIDMATIRQQLTPATQILTPDCSSEESKDPANSAYTHTSSQNGVDATTPMGSRHFFEVEREDSVFLAPKVLFETPSDHSLALPKASARSLESPSPEPARKRQRVDINSIVF